MKVDAILMDGDRNVIDLDRWDWKCDGYPSYQVRREQGFFRSGPLLSGVPNLMAIPLYATKDQLAGGQRGNFLHFGNWSSGPEAKNNFSVSIAPLCMALSSSSSSALIYRTNSTITRRVRFSADQMKALDDIKISFSFQAKDDNP